MNPPLLPDPPKQGTVLPGSSQKPKQSQNLIAFLVGLFVIGILVIKNLDHGDSPTKRESVSATGGSSASKSAPGAPGARHHPKASIPFKILERQFFERALSGPWKIEVGLVENRLPTANELSGIVQELVDKASGPRDDEQYYVEFYLPGMAGKSGGGSMAFAVGGLDLHERKDVMIQYHPDNQPGWPQEYQALAVPKGNWEIAPGTHTKGPLEVEFALAVAKEGTKSIIEGKTNLPDGMTIQVALSGGKFYSDAENYKVKNGMFGGAWPNLPAGKFNASARVLNMIGQPLSVRAVIGIWGANLTGPFVKDKRYDVGVDVKAEFTQQVLVPRDETERALDLLAVYQRELSKLYTQLLDSKAARDFGRNFIRDFGSKSPWGERFQVLRGGDIPTLEAFDAISALKALAYEYEKSQGTETDQTREYSASIDTFLGFDRKR